MKRELRLQTQEEPRREACSVVYSETLYIRAMEPLDKITALKARGMLGCFATALWCFADYLFIPSEYRIVSSAIAVGIFLLVMFGPNPFKTRS